MPSSGEGGLVYTTSGKIARAAPERLRLPPRPSRMFCLRLFLLRVSLLGALFWLTGVCVQARASGFSVARFGGEHGHPTTDNPTALYYNPAALVLAEQPQLFADLTLAVRRANYTRQHEPGDASPPADAASANVGRATLTNVLLSPALGLTLPYEGFTFGVAWFTPFGGQAIWDRREEYVDHPRLPGPADGVQRWHSIEGQTFTSYLAIGAARRVLDETLALGVSLNLIGTLLSDVRARGDGTNDPEEEGRALLEARGLAFGVGLGLLYEARPGELWLGASYQSRPNLRGGIELRGTAEGKLGTTTRADVEVTYDLPDVVRLGARYLPRPWVELRLFGDYTRWSAFERQCIRFVGGTCRLSKDGSQLPGSGVLQNLPRNFRDSVGVRAGVSLFLENELEVFSGVGFDSSAVPDATMEASLPDFTLVSFALGVRGEVLPNFYAALSLTELLAMPRQIESSLSNYRVPSRQPDASGHYAQFVLALNANVQYTF